MTVLQELFDETSEGSIAFRVACNADDLFAVRHWDELPMVDTGEASGSFYCNVASIICPGIQGGIEDAAIPELFGNEG